MYVQDKAQNWNQGMTREALILAKANGTLRCLGATDQEISAIVEKFKDPAVDSMRYLKETLQDYRRRYDAGSSAYAAIDRLITDCKAAERKNCAE